MDKVDIRIFKIIKILLAADDYISSVIIAEKAGMSESTFFRLLPLVERYLLKTNLSINKIRGKGFMLSGNETDKASLIAELSRRKHNEAFSQIQTCFLIFLYLLYEKDTTKLTALSTTLEVSESSISKILIVLESKLKGSGCSISRKPGIGTCIAGDEISIRMAALNNACLHLDLNEFMSILYKFMYEPNAKQKTLFYSFTSVVFDYLKNKTNIRTNFLVIENIEKRCGVDFSDTDFLLLFLYISIAEIRCSNNFYIFAFNQIANQAQTALYKIIKDIFSDTYGTDFGIAANETEISFFEDIVQSTEYINFSNDKREYEQTAADLLALIKTSLGAYIVAPQKAEYLFYQYIIHIVKKYKHGFSFDQNFGYLFENPQNTIPKKKREHLVKKLKVFLQTQLNLSLQDDECYNFLNLSSLFLEHPVKDFSVAFVCASGLMVSTILKEQIETHFPEISTWEALSIRKLNNDYIKKNNIDFVISSIAVGDLSVPVAYISIPLKDKDIEVITEIIQILGEKNA